MSTAILQPRRLPEAIRIRNSAACMTNGELANAIQQSSARLMLARGATTIGRAERRLHILQAEADHRMGRTGGGR